MSMRIITDECLGCGACMMTCPQKAIEEQCPSAGIYVYVVLAERCNDCPDEPASLCRGVCPVPECLVSSR